MNRFHALLMFMLIIAGCGRTNSGPVGGTPGTLRLGDAPLADFHVKVLRGSDGSLLATGATNWEGKFQLVASDNQSAYRLEPGDYVCVLESFGTDAPKLSAAYSDKSKSPLKLTWTSTDQTMELVLPLK